MEPGECGGFWHPTLTHGGDSDTYILPNSPSMCGVWYFSVYLFNINFQTHWQNAVSDHVCSWNVFQRWLYRNYNIKRHWFASEIELETLTLPLVRGGHLGEQLASTWQMSTTVYIYNLYGTFNVITTTYPSWDHYANSCLSAHFSAIFFPLRQVARNHGLYTSALPNKFWTLPSR